MSINLSALPSMPSLDTSSLPSAAEVGDVLVTALDTAGEAATVVVQTARRRPRIAVGVATAALMALMAMMMLRRRRRANGAMVIADPAPKMAAA